MTRTAASTAAKAVTIATLSFVAILLCLIVAKKFFIGYYHIPPKGNGMYPTLAPGDHLFTVRRPYSDASSVKCGDIVVFERVENGQIYDHIWRVVALPGEKVEASRESLVINGQPVQRQRRFIHPTLPSQLRLASSLSWAIIGFKRVTADTSDQSSSVLCLPRGFETAEHSVLSAIWVRGHRRDPDRCGTTRQHPCSAGLGETMPLGGSDAELLRTTGRMR